MFAREAGNVFRAPKRTLGNLDADIAAQLIAAAADIALVVDAKGIVRDVSFGAAEYAEQGCDQWVGKRFLDIVTSESRPKVQEMLRDAADKAPLKWRQLNHPAKNGADFPVRYAALQIG